MSGIELNKIAAAILLAGLIAMIAGLVTEGLYHENEGEKRGYTVEGVSTGGTTAAAPAAEEKPVDITPYLAKADPKQGEQLIGRCQVCHTFEKGKPNGVGPNQFGLVGRKIASAEGFNYSDALKAKGGTWSFQALSDFLASPQKAVPGTRMAFAGLKKPEERAALIVYINKTFSDRPLAVPAK
jgi:cytochrome c